MIINFLLLVSCRQSMNKNQTSSHRNTSKLSLLEKTCDLIRNFPEYFDVVVSVARKTDGRHWTDLFSAAGRSTEYVFLFFFALISNFLLVLGLEASLMYIRNLHEIVAQLNFDHLVVCKLIIQSLSLLLNGFLDGLIVEHPHCIVVNVGL